MTQPSSRSTHDSARRTRIVNLYGAPSSGKTVKMLQLATVAKLAGHFCEVCPEVAKEYVIQEIPITPAIQLEITREQFRRMKQFVSYVDYLVTDAPILIGAFYAEDHAYAEAPGLLAEFQTYRRELHEVADIVNVYVTRQHRFIQHGRYQTEEHAQRIEHDMLRFVQNHHDTKTLLQIPSTTDPAELWPVLQSAAREPSLA
jgi:hypothetical protein